jgi:hypothetical protein
VQARVEFAGDPPAIARDEHGNALGGIRLPHLAVPTATHRGASPAGVPDLSGSSTPFSADFASTLSTQAPISRNSKRPSATASSGTFYCSATLCGCESKPPLYEFHRNLRAGINRLGRDR